MAVSYLPVKPNIISLILFDIRLTQPRAGVPSLLTAIVYIKDISAPKLIFITQNMAICNMNLRLRLPTGLSRFIKICLEICNRSASMSAIIIKHIRTVKAMR